MTRWVKSEREETETIGTNGTVFIDDTVTSHIQKIAIHGINRHQIREDILHMLNDYYPTHMPCSVCRGKGTV